MAMNGDVSHNEPLAVVLAERGRFWSGQPHDGAAAPQKPSAEKVLRQIRKFVELVGAKAVAVNLTRDELARALAARADATLAALGYDLDCFARFCLANKYVGLPAAHETVARYVEQLWQSGPSLAATSGGAGRLRAPIARRVKPASIARRLASIAMLHTLLRLPNPCADANVKNAMTIAKRSVGARQLQAAPIRLAALGLAAAPPVDGPGAEAAGQGGNARASAPAGTFTLELLLAACDDSLGGLRDAAMLSVAYDGGFRVSELTGFVLGNVVGLELSESAGPPRIFVARSKTDQNGQGAWVRLYPETMRHLRAWVEVAGIEGDGDKPLFRRIQAIVRKGNKGRRALEYHELAPNAGFSVARLKAIPPRETQVWHEVGEGGLSTSGVNLILRRIALRSADMGLVDLAGEALDQAVKALSTHSMRVGLAQDLRGQKISDSEIMKMIRWQDPKSLLRYVENVPSAENAAVQLLEKARR